MSGHWSDWIFSPFEDLAGAGHEIGSAAWKWLGSERNWRLDDKRRKNRKGRRKSRRKAASKAGITGCLQAPKSGSRPAGGPASRLQKPPQAAQSATRKPQGLRPASNPITRLPAASRNNRARLARVGGKTMNDFEGLTEAPETDAEHMEKLNGLAKAQEWLSSITEEYVSMCHERGFDRQVTAALERMAELAAELAQECVNAAQDFASAYEGVRETAASGISIPEGKGFWTGEGGL